MAKMRLDKYLVHVGYGTRSTVQKLIKGKKVQVNDSVVQKPETSINPDTAVVKVGGRIMDYQEFYYFILNKPGGYITATEDKKLPTVVDLLEEEDRNKDVAPVGRLDKDTEGLLVLTNDGKTTHEILSPKKHVDKVYYARVAGKVVTEDCAKFAAGMILEDGTVFAPGKLEIISSGEESEIYVTIKEGKFHQVKRMVQAIGKEVVYLKRIKMGNFSLPEDLEIGEYRQLTKEELKQLKGEA
ncbi:pseudouridine synthase [Cellulosilyticum ruminicola]|nr:pseudouridine synthase [Cellulosilyticum ruminicola]